MKWGKRELIAWMMVFVFLLEDPTVVRAYEWSGYSSQILYEEEQKEEEKKSDLFEYHITYELNGGISSDKNVTRYRYGDLPIMLEPAKRVGYNFAGWYSDSHFRKKVFSISKDMSGDIVLYAKWTKKIDDAVNINRYSYHTDAKVSRNSKTLKDCEYQVLENVSIPGMPSTREEDMRKQRIVDENQCPQGICLTEEFILVTAYSADWDVVGSLYMFDRKTGEYIATLGMKRNSHLGGLTYDGRNVWICHSDNTTLERISYRMLQTIAKKKPQNFIDCSTSIEAFKVQNRPSCITYHDGKLWVATENDLLKSKVVAYCFDGTRLNKLESYTIPARVQGIDFGKDGKVYLSTSLGRTKSSYLRVYDSLEAMDEKPNKPMKKVEMPPCSEELEIQGDSVYVLFESAGQKYYEGTDGKGSSISPLEKIISIRLDSI